MKHVKLFEDFGSSAATPSVEYVGRAGDKVTVMLEDGGYVGILSDADHAKLEAQGPRELYRFPAEGKSFVIINDYPLEIDVIGEGEDAIKCENAYWINSKGQENPNEDADELTCYTIPPAGQIMSAEADGHSFSTTLYRNVDELISSVYGN
jgi:hypothetical protein